MNKEKRICETCKKEFIPIDKINYHCQECQPCKSVDITMHKEIKEILDSDVEILMNEDGFNTFALPESDFNQVSERIKNLFTSKLKDIIEEVEGRLNENIAIVNSLRYGKSFLSYEIQFLQQILTKLKELAE